MIRKGSSEGLQVRDFQEFGFWHESVKAFSGRSASWSLFARIYPRQGLGGSNLSPLASLNPKHTLNPRKLACKLSEHARLTCRKALIPVENTR